MEGNGALACPADLCTHTPAEWQPRLCQLSRAPGARVSVVRSLGCMSCLPRCYKLVINSLPTRSGPLVRRV